MNYIVFEDNNCHLLKPLSDLHASFEVRIGAFNNIDRIINHTEKGDTVQLYVRDEIESLIKNKYPNFDVNPDSYKPGRYLNGSAVWDFESMKKINENLNYCNDKGLMAFHSSNSINKNDLKYKFNDFSEVFSKIEIPSIKYLWDVFELIKDAIILDNKILHQYRVGDLHPSSILINEDDIIISEGTKVSANSILDASQGPIILEKDSFVDIGALIKGPVYIGKNSIINPGTKIRGSVVIGPSSKIGGELEDCVIQGFSNKQHDGFLGHSYICEWVNIGANTNTSDLKNNYGNIKLKLDYNNEVDTGKMFIGSLIGDFCCTAISTKLNSGTVVGIGSNLFDDGFQNKYIEPFSWGKKDRVDLNKFINTAERIMKRRSTLMTDSLKKRLIKLYKN
ncbi:MAG: hypothetical protein CMG00_02115 [Candidatus Marinimicrobia bacterium]|nr:hypothetical protein [Candidatus Neomarinimicrobiota bacterium]